MDTISDILNKCEEFIEDNESISKEELNEIVNITYLLVSKIEDFGEKYGDRTIGYYGEYLRRDNNAKEDALDVMGEILDEMNYYFDN